MKRGEVRWYRFRQPDKKRPVLILTRDPAIELLDEVTIAPITSRIREIPTEVRLGPDEGMPRPCVVLLDHLQTVAKARIGAELTTLGAGKLREVRAALLYALGF
jgi:mRNA interferase MazF